MGRGRDSLRDRFWEYPLADLNRAEWEALCDGCGLCCLNKIEDEETGEIFNTNVACDLLDLQSCRCMHYETRHQYVPICISLKIEDIPHLPWLPKSCAYRLRYEERALPPWHYLISGDRKSVLRAGLVDREQLIHERDMEYDLEEYVMDADEL